MRNIILKRGEVAGLSLKSSSSTPLLFHDLAKGLATLMVSATRDSTTGSTTLSIIQQYEECPMVISDWWRRGQKDT